jgi:riboflavin kinase/FMN adenylyltransferase
MTAAAELLGRHFYINAKVIHGDARGRTMGFPTANLEVDSPHIIPIDGIYATYTTIDRKKYSSATSIGLRPTFGGKERVVETFVLDYTGDLYGSDIKVEFVERVRDQVYFETADALAEQMDSDIYNIRNLLNNKRHDMQN